MLITVPAVHEVRGHSTAASPKASLKNSESPRKAKPLSAVIASPIGEGPWGPKDPQVAWGLITKPAGDGFERKEREIRLGPWLPRAFMEAKWEFPKGGTLCWVRKLRLRSQMTEFVERPRDCNLTVVTRQAAF